MAKEFSDSEKNIIRSTLLTAGRDLFAKYGLKKTGIGELTRIAGISQGSFYSFYQSKEELYFEILEKEEQTITQLINDLINSYELTKRNFKLFMNEYYKIVHGNIFIENLVRNKEYAMLMRKLPEEKRKRHLLNESSFFKSIIERLHENGSIKKIDPDVLSGFYYAIFLLQLHKKEIGESIFPQIMDFITDLLAEGLVIKE